MTASTSISSQQTLLSTIYKQSWHPVASTKYVVNNRGPKRPEDAKCLAGNLQKNLPFHSRPDCPHQKQVLKPRQSKHGPSVRKRYLRNTQSPNRDTHPSASVLSAAKANESDLQVPSPPNSLSAWKRQLRTCVDSNPRHHITKSEAAYRTQLSKNSGNRNLAFSRQQSWASDCNSTKCYKILNYQNSTLSSICVQGKDPPTKSRVGMAMRSRSNSYSTPLSPNRIENPKNPEVSIFSPVDGSNQSSFMMSQNNDETMAQSDVGSSTNTETDQEFSDNDDVNTDDVFQQQQTFFEDHLLDSSHDVITSRKSRDVDELEIPNLDLMNLTFPQDGAELSDNESDISEQEMSSDEDDGFADSQGSNERSRNAVEKYKELYKNENVSDNNNVTSMKNQTLKNENQTTENTNEPEKYEFVLALPKKFQKYNLKELSTLPTDVNWRNLVKLADLWPDCRVATKAGGVARRRRPRSCKKAENQNKMETLVDRLLALEKLQRATLQAESMNRYHVAHVRATAAAAKIKAQNAKTALNHLGNNDEKQSGSPSDPCGVTSKTPSRRRSSVPLASARLAWANEITQGGQSILKEANRSGDFSAVIDDWSSKNRPTKCCNERGRRSSENSVKKFRSRWIHPRFYQYHWSERIKDDKVRTTPFWTTRLRSCQTCREKWRKIITNEIQERRRRPSTANSSCVTTGRRFSAPDKILIRPKSTWISLSTSSALLSSNVIKEKPTPSFSPSKANNEVTINESEATTNSLNDVTMKQTNNRQNRRQTIFTSAFRVSSAPFSKRPQTTWANG